MKVKRNIDVTIELSPKEVAKIFWDMTDEEQACFFNELSNVAGDSLSGNFEKQMSNVFNSGKLKEEGKRVMATIGEYSSDLPF